MHDVLKNRLRLVNAAGTAGVILLLTGVSVFGILPCYRQGRQNIAETARLRMQLQALGSLEQLMHDKESGLKASESRLAQVETRVPASSETNSFIRDLAGVTRAAGIEVDSTTYPKELRDAGAYKSLPVEVTGTGSWDSCYRFLTGLRSMDRLTRLDSLVLELDRDAKAQRPMSCRITVGFSTFFMAR